MNGLISLENISLRPVSEEILALNEISKNYGLVLSEEDAKELSDTRNTSIAENERVEIGAGAITEIIKRFCTSKYVNDENYAYVLNEITYLFYYIKTETDDKISDGELIKELFNRFELFCHGNIDTLEAREAERIIRKVNSGENYLKWYKDRDELDYTGAVGSREAPVEFEDAENPHTARAIKVSSYEGGFFDDDTVADHDMYEDDQDLNGDDFNFDATMDAFDEFFDRDQLLSQIEPEYIAAAKEDMDDDEEDENE